MQLRSLLKKPGTIAVLFILGVLLLYLYFSRPIEEARDVAVFGNHAYLATAKDGLRVVDVSDPQQPVEIGFFDTSGSANAIEVLVQSSGEEAIKYAYIADGKAGISIYDVTHPDDIKIIGWLDLPGEAVDIEILGGIAYIASGKAGVQVVGVQDPRSPVKISSYKTKGEALSVAHDGGTMLYLGDSKKGLIGLNTSNPVELVPVGSYNTRTEIFGIALFREYILAAAGPQGLEVLEWVESEEKGAQITKIASTTDPNDVYDIVINGIYAYLANGKHGLRVLDISTPTKPVEVGANKQLRGTVSLEVVGDTVYTANGFDGLRVVSSPVNATFRTIGTQIQQGFTQDVAVGFQYAYLANGEHGVQVVDVINPAEPVAVASRDLDGDAAAIALKSDYAYIADRQNRGIQILPIIDPTRLSENPLFYPTVDQPNDIVIVGNTVYVADGNAGLRLINIEIPLAPKEIGFVDTPGNAVGVTVVREHAYVADGGEGLRIINVSNPGLPLEVGHFNTIGDARAVAILEIREPGEGPQAAEGQPRIEMEVETAPSRLVAFVADGSGGLRIIDVTEPHNPSLVGVYDSPEFVQDVIVSGDHAFLAAREQGLLALEVTTLSDPQLVGVLDTPGKASRIFQQGGFAYVADFERGMRIADISYPQALKEIGFYDEPNKAQDVELVGDYAYLVDGDQGLWVMDVSRPRARRPVGFYKTPGQARSLNVTGEYTYIADGTGGLQVLYTLEPSFPIHVSSLETTNEALAVDIQDTFAYIVEGEVGMQIVDVSNPITLRSVGIVDTAGTALDVTVKGDYAYIADGSAGLRIVNISDARNPATVAVFETLDDARALTVRGGYAYIANGEAGLWILNISNPTAPQFVGMVDTPGIAVDVVVSDAYAFVADTSGGVSAVYIANLWEPSLVGSSEVAGGAVGLAAVSIGGGESEPMYFNLFVADPAQGLQVFEVKKVAQPEVWGLYETPGTASWEQVTRTLLSRDPQDTSRKALRSIGQVFFDLVIVGVLSLALWVTFISQFVLPVYTTAERRKAINQLFTYLSGGHGPAIFIREGREIAKAGELQRRGPGVMLVDSCSAVVLERRGKGGSRIAKQAKVLAKPISRILSGPAKPDTSPAVRVVGPGLAFTKPKERIRGVVDLRPQFRRREGVNGYTNDGIEVSCRVFAQFSLGEDPEVLQVAYDGDRSAENLRVVATERKLLATNNGGPNQWVIEVKSILDLLDENDKTEIHRFVQAGVLIPKEQKPGTQEQDDKGAGSPFKFNQDRVFNAVYSRAKHVVKDQPTDWRELPTYVAADIFRNMISRHAYDNLYKPKDPNQYPLMDLRSNFRNTLRNQGVLSYEYIERRDGGRLIVGQELIEDDLLIYNPKELEFPKVLRVRGIKVMLAGFSELTPVDPEVRRRLFEYWSSLWEKAAEILQVDYDESAFEVYSKARASAQSRIIGNLVKIFESSEYSQEAMALLLMNALETAAAEPETRRLLPDHTIQVLRSFQHWLLEDEKSSDRELPPDAPVQV